MLRNLFKTSFVALLKTKSTLILNVSGLAIGVAACLLAYLHIDYELSFDKHFSKSDQLYRVVVGDMVTGEGWVKVSTPIPPLLKQDIPEIEEFARMTQYSYNEKVSVSYDNQAINESGIFLVDRAFFDFFDVDIRNGRMASTMPYNGIYLSETASKKHFGNEDPIGKTLEVAGKDRYEVQGVYADFLSNSHVEPDYLISFENLEKVLPGTSLTGNWGQFNYFAYVQLTEGADLQKVIPKIRSQVVSFGNDQEMKFENLTLQAVTDVHFQASPGNVKSSYDKRYLYVYAAIALAITIISLINFMNLTIAGSSRRMKEVGVRKVMGASKQQLTIQFIVEGFIISGVSILVGIGLARLALPFQNQIIGSQSGFNFGDPVFYLLTLGLIATIALVSGLYIAFFVLSFHPVKALKGGLKIGKKGANFRNGLLVMQFMMSTILLLSSVFIYRQFDYMTDSELGIDQEQLVTLQLFDKEAQKKLPTLKAELSGLSEVKSMATSRFVPGQPNWNQTVHWEGQEDEVSWGIIEIGEGFLETYGIDIIQGDEAVINGQHSGSLNFLVNEAAVKAAGWEDPLNTFISPYGKNGYAPIMGVIGDFHFRSMHNAIEPLIMVIRPVERHNQLTIKLASSDYGSLMPKIEQVYSEVLGNTPFEYAFVDNQFEALYQVERKTMQLVGILTSIAILLAMLGMYALLSFTIKERTKEIALRKVLGINVSAMLNLLANKYLRLLILGNVLGIPITWYLLKQWLQNFSYHIEMNLMGLVATSLLSFVILLVVVSSKVAQTVNINPTDALRNE